MYKTEVSSATKVTSVTEGTSVRGRSVKEVEEFVMTLKKIIAAAAAAAISVSALAVNAFAADEYTAVIGFADTLFSAQDWETSVTVTGDGSYSIESTLAAGAQDIGMLVVDIKKMSAEASEASAVLDSIEIDGKKLDFDSDSISYGDIEGNGNYRIEIVNQYIDDAAAPAIDRDTAVNSSVKVTFTVSGLGEAPAEEESVTSAPEETPAETSESVETTVPQDTEDTEAVAAVGTGVSEETAPEADLITTSATTGNVSRAAMLFVMTAAGLAAALSKKKR